MAHSSKSKDIWFSTIKSRSVTGMGYNRMNNATAGVVPLWFCNVVFYGQVAELVTQRGIVIQRVMV